MPDAEAPTPLAGVFPPRLVARLHRERFEGTLRLHGGGATRVIYFRRGEIASAASNADEDRLPNILIRDGRLTGPQVEMARAKQRPGVSLGKTLIELGFLTPAELLQGARRQVRQILAAAFTLREGTSQESPGPLPPEVTVLGLPVRRLIFDALLEAGDRQTVVQEMGSMETVYRPAADLETALPTLRLEPQHEEVARLVDGRATLREISGRVRLDDLTVSKVVLAMEILGLVEQETPRLGTGGGRRIPVIAPEEPEEAPMKVASEAWAGGGAPVAASPEPARAMAAPPPVAPPVRAPSPGLGAVPASVPYAPSWPQATEESDESATEIAFEEEAETPPIPPGELPAFAAPLNAPTGWSVDPETGEKVHLGPVELTFDGPVVPPLQKGVGRGRLALFGAAGLLGVAAVVAWFVVRGESAPDTGRSSPAELASVATGTEAPAAGRAPSSEDAPEAAAPDPGQPGGTPGAPHEPPSEPAPAAAPAEALTGPPVGTATSPPTEVVPPRQEAAPKPTGPPAETRAATETTGATRGTGQTEAAVDFGFGQRLLDAGTVDRAAEAFRRAITPLPTGRFTLQTMIACEAETVRKARAGTKPDAGLFVLPVAMKGRGCFRVMWGVFETRAAAEEARADLPRYFATAGVSPAVVAIDRLRSSS